MRVNGCDWNDLSSNLVRDAAVSSIVTSAR